jgi:hypothetical protein
MTGQIERNTDKKIEKRQTDRKKEKNRKTEANM